MSTTEDDLSHNFFIFTYGRSLTRLGDGLMNLRHGELGASAWLLIGDWWHGCNMFCRLIFLQLLGTGDATFDFPKENFLIEESEKSKLFLE